MSITPVSPEAAADQAQRVRLDAGWLGWQRLRMALQIAWVRLRFVIALAAIFLVVGKWQLLRNGWDKLLAAVLPGDVAETVSPDTEYFCPMCPGVVSDWPAKCPVCNMALVRRPRGQAVALADGVTARMQFSPYRIQLAGIRTTPAAYLPLEHELSALGIVRQEDQALWVDVELFERDLPFVADGRPAEVAALGGTGAPPCPGTVRQVMPLITAGVGSAQVALEPGPASKGLLSGMRVMVRIKTPVADMAPFRSLPGDRPEGQVLAVPAGAVVDTGMQQVVYVERGPGMFDGVLVELGPRAGGYYPVIRGLEAGQRVATAGAFLIDAETRLNTSVAASYFGASRGSVAAPAPIPQPAPPQRPAAQQADEDSP